MYILYSRRVRDTILPLLLLLFLWRTTRGVISMYIQLIVKSKHDKTFITHARMTIWSQKKADSTWLSLNSPLLSTWPPPDPPRGKIKPGGKKSEPFPNCICTTWLLRSNPWWFHRRLKLYIIFFFFHFFFPGRRGVWVGGWVGGPGCKIFRHYVAMYVLVLVHTYIQSRVRVSWNCRVTLRST